MMGFSLGDIKVGQLSRMLSKRPSGEKAEHVTHIQEAANLRHDSRPRFRSTVRGNVRSQTPYYQSAFMHNPWQRGTRWNSPTFRCPSNSNNSQRPSNRTV